MNRVYLADWRDVIFIQYFIGDFERAAVKNFIFHEDYWIWITNRRLEKSFAIFGRKWRQYNQAYFKFMKFDDFEQKRIPGTEEYHAAKH